MEMEDLIWFRETFTKVDFPIIMFGNSGVGKTSLTIKFFSNFFKKNWCKTLIARNATGTRRIDEVSVHFNVWDISGSVYRTKFPFLDLKNMKAAIIVYDVNNYRTLETAKRYVKDVSKVMHNQVISLVANKIDLKIEGKNCLDEGKKFAKEKGLNFFESSANTGKNVKEMFYKSYHAVGQKRYMWWQVLRSIL